MARQLLKHHLKKKKKAKINLIPSSLWVSCLCIRGKTNHPVFLPTLAPKPAFTWLR